MERNDHYHKMLPCHLLLGVHGEGIKIIFSNIVIYKVIYVQNVFTTSYILVH
jgi:hypothetical protein